MTKDIEAIGDLLQPVVSAALGNVWGVFIWDLDLNCEMVIRPGDPLDDKWITVYNFGPHPSYAYVVWKNRL